MLTGDDARRRLSVVLAINGLKDTNRKRELMAKHGIDREELKRLLKTMSVERHAVDVLVGNYDGTTPIKKEVGVVYNITKRILYNASGHYKDVSWL